jgi:hypothetical protein
MAITQGLPTSFKVDLLNAKQNFTSDSFKIALYTASATLDATTTAYTTTNEVSGTGYTAGGKAVTVASVPGSSGTVAFVTFSTVTWAASTITARGALIYNDTLAGKNAVAILDFGSDKTTTASTFTISFPANTADSALIRIG